MTDTLGDKLYSLLDTGVVVPYVQRRTSDWAPEENECHGNVDNWVQRNPGTEAIRGWLFFDLRPAALNIIFTAHSLVMDSTGEWLDITPNSRASRRYPFIKHPGTDAEFEELVETHRVTNFWYTVA